MFVLGQTVAVIGSFRQHYEVVLDTIRIFYQAGIPVMSPKGSPILEPGIPFVRFETDAERDSDALVQSKTLHRIFRASATYVVAPCGYVGNTTCYEIGRLLQASRPIYFSAQPTDLPIRVPPSHICEPEHLRDILLSDNGPSPLYAPPHPEDEHQVLEAAILDGNYRDV